MFLDQHLNFLFLDQHSPRPRPSCPACCPWLGVLPALQNSGSSCSSSSHALLSSHLPTPLSWSRLLLRVLKIWLPDQPVSLHPAAPSWLCPLSSPTQPPGQCPQHTSLSTTPLSLFFCCTWPAKRQPSSYPRLHLGAGKLLQPQGCDPSNGIVSDP